MLEFPGDEAQGHVIDLASAVNVGAIFCFEQCHALVAALEKALPGDLVIDVHTEEIDIKLFRPREILDVEHYVVDAGNLER